MQTDDPVVNLMQNVFDSVGQLRNLVMTQQETLAGIARMIEVHTQALQAHQMSIEGLASRAGICP